MSVELLPDSRYYADELLRLRRDNAALKVALEDKSATCDALRLENAELKHKAARFASHVRAVAMEYLK